MSRAETPFILASQSAARRSMLTRAGFNFTAEAADLDEVAIAARMVADGSTPLDIAQHLAGEKALAVSARNPSALVIAADTVLDFEGRLLMKAETQHEARENLLRMKGKHHALHTAASIACDRQIIWQTSDTAIMQVRNFDDAFLDVYCEKAAESLTAAAGGYQLEDIGVWLFEKIEGDFFTILGLPLLQLVNYLHLQHGIKL